MTDLTEWIKERRRIHDAATEGPWAKEEDEAWGDTYASLSIQRVGEAWDSDPAHACCDPLDGENVLAIVDAHNTLPALLTAVENVLEVLDAGVRDGDGAELIRSVALAEIEEAINE
ncbi:hypothetical protein [Brevibacterium sp. UCMA 11752]|uniref:hypothetical protein n=1 Tax=Brevibacterium sp. UCMA 11752 TaxID=2745946 RepID=UPI001F294BB7|nr:hypothetical protein [Brevibacterium sp. UCMA 11752]MCF2588941.1 hypothetical protein [Brevibacterium sp. UCMA 11752]